LAVALIENIETNSNS